jgi:predicted O-methyltransferase YrrM
MNLAGRIRYWWRTRPQHPARYANLLRTIRERRCRRLVEIGTWNGEHARQMIETAALAWPRREIEYVGFDLFEDLTEAQRAAEFSKRPPAMAEVARRLEATGARVRLIRGDTRETLPAAASDLAGADLVFLDGGHAIETIASDWAAIERFATPETTILLDDYYVDPAPALDGLGCQSLVDALDRARWNVELLDPVDVFPQAWGALKIRIARVQRR